MSAQYSIGTWCGDRQAYSPQKGLGGPSINITLAQLRDRVRELRRNGYSCHRVRDAEGNYDNNDWTVLIERTDGMTIAEVRKSWIR